MGTCPGTLGNARACLVGHLSRKMLSQPQSSKGKAYRNDCICNLVRIMTSTRFVTAFFSQKSTFFDFLLVTGPYTNLTLQKIKLSNRGFYLGQYGIF